MTEAERAAALADEIERFGAGHEKRYFEIGEETLIVRALRAYSTPVSTDEGLREAVAEAMNGGSLPPTGDSVAHLCVAQYRVDAFEKADAALSAIHASGCRAVPADYTDRIVSEARRYASHYPIGSDGRNTFEMFADFVVRLAAAPTPSDARSDNDPLRETF